MRRAGPRERQRPGRPVGGPVPGVAGAAGRFLRVGRGGGAGRPRWACPRGGRLPAAVFRRGVLPGRAASGGTLGRGAST